jgi:hypothetical protein
MFGWLTNAFKTLIGAGAAATASSVQAALNVISVIFDTTYKYWHTVAGHVGGGWQELTRTLLYLRNNMQQYTFAQYAFDLLILRKYIPWLSNWISWLGGKIQRDLGTLRGLLHREIVAGDNAQHAYTRSVLLWVVVHVLGFLLGLVRSAFAWINGVGATMWHYFTHLADFAELLFMFLVEALERHAWDVGGLLGKFFLALIVKNVVRFATLVETIIDAVL